jgi:hypothetical protein
MSHPPPHPHVYGGYGPPPPGSGYGYNYGPQQHPSQHGYPSYPPPSNQLQGRYAPPPPHYPQQIQQQQQQQHAQPAQSPPPAAAAPPPPTSTPNAAPAVPYIGARISLTSNMNIRYEGVLYTIDTQASTVALQHVRCFGTEDRPGNFVPASSEVYEVR